MMIRPDARFIAKEYLGFFASRQLPNPRIFRTEPALHRFRLLLIGSPHRTLRCQAQLRQQSTYGSFTQFDSKLPEDQRAHHTCRPQSKCELHLHRILHGHGRVNPTHRLTIQLVRTPATLASIQSIPAPTTIFREPPVNCSTAHPYRFRHHFRAFSLLDSPHSSLPQFRQRLMIQSPGISISHAEKYTQTPKSMSIQL